MNNQYIFYKILVLLPFFSLWLYSS